MLRRPRRNNSHAESFALSQSSPKSPRSEAKRAGRKTRMGDKTRHKCFHTFPPPFIRRDAQGNLAGPPNSPRFSVVGLCRVRASILERRTRDFQRMKTSPCQAGAPGFFGGGGRGTRRLRGLLLAPCCLSGAWVAVGSGSSWLRWPELARRGFQSSAGWGARRISVMPTVQALTEPLSF